LTKPAAGFSSEWADFSSDQMKLLARVLLQVVREIGRQVPPPRGAPFFGLDHPAGDFSPYERLAARGIFRKYESVLLIGCGLGGAVRWCHAHFGCDVTGTDPAVAAAASAAALSSRAHLGAHTRFVAAADAALPLAAKRFTHAWAIEVLPDARAGDRRLREIFRTVRPGALAAVQQSAPGPSWSSATIAAMQSAGFVEVEAKETRRQAVPDTMRRARARLLDALAADPRGDDTATGLERLYRRWSGEGGPVVQVFGRRPA